MEAKMEAESTTNAKEKAKQTLTLVAVAVIAVGLTLFVFWCLEKLGKTSAFHGCPATNCAITKDCQLVVNWWKFPNTMWPNQKLTVETKDENTNTLEKAQAWVLAKSKILTYGNPSTPICIPVILSYPKDPNATQFSYGHTSLVGTLDANPDLDTYIFASEKPNLQVS